MNNVIINIIRKKMNLNSKLSDLPLFVSLNDLN